MDLKQLQYFVVCAQTGSFSEAAKNLYSTQPSVSKVIKGLEDTLGMQLFERLPRGIRLTVQGKKVYQYASKIINEIDVLENMASRGMTKWIRISMNPSSWFANQFVDFYNETYEKKYHFQVTTAGVQSVMERVRDYYKANPAFNEIGLEDYFLGHELSSHIQDFSGNKEQERQLMQMIILDAIYNEGKINELYKVFPDKLKKFLINYDAIFTLNYDTNLDSYLEGSVPIYHIHGSFDDISVGHEDEPEEWKHMYCNGIMTWYWVEKYGQEHSDIRYGIKEFSQIEDRVDIIGLSACNDEQLFVQLSQNGKLNKCDFYYYDSNDAVEIRKHLCGTLQNHITIKNVRNF